MKGIILAGGLGTRLDPLTRVVNKCILPIYNKPMIYYPIITLKNLGITDILIVVGGNSVGSVINLLQDGKELGVSLTYKYQDKPLGIAHAVRLTKDWVGQNCFAVLLSDNIFEYFLKEKRDGWTSIIESYPYNSDDGHIFISETKTPERFGVLVKDENGTIIDIEEKPKNPKSNYAVTGLYFYRPIVFDMIDKLKLSERGEYEITDLNKKLLERNSLYCEEVPGEWIDTGSFDNFLRASNLIKEKGL